MTVWAGVGVGTFPTVRGSVWEDWEYRITGVILLYHKNKPRPDLLPYFWLFYSCGFIWLQIRVACAQWYLTGRAKGAFGDGGTFLFTKTTELMTKVTDFYASGGFCRMWGQQAGLDEQWLRGQQLGTCLTAADPSFTAAYQPWGLLAELFYSI